MTEAELKARLKEYHFYHTIPLGGGLSTPGWPKILRLTDMLVRNLRTLDLAGKRVLDVGCRDGLLSFEAERLGAAEVVGIDNDLSRGAVELLIPYLRSRVRMHLMNLLDLRPESFGTFDVVVCAGVLYHLRYPFWGLKLLKDVLRPGGTLLLETAVYVDDNRKAILFCPTGEDSPLEETSCTFFNLKGLADTLHSLGLQVQRHELYDRTHEHLANRRRLRVRVRSWLSGRREEEQVPLDRVTMVCRADPGLVDRHVSNYWHGTHRIHTLNTAIHDDQAVAGPGR
jgi:SAM-dependent methyltransferase